MDKPWSAITLFNPHSKLHVVRTMCYFTNEKNEAQCGLRPLPKITQQVYSSQDLNLGSECDNQWHTLKFLIHFEENCLLHFFSHMGKWNGE